MKRVNLLIKAILSLVLAVLAVLMAWQELLAADGRRAPQQTASQPGGCRHKMTAHNGAQLSCTIATNEAAFFAYLVAMPRHCFRCRKTFSTLCLAL